MTKWTIEYYSQDVIDWLNDLPVGLRASYVKLMELLKEFGMDLRLPHSRAIGQGLFELRLKAKEGIARVLYCTLINPKIMVLHSFKKKTEKTPRSVLAIATNRMKELKNEQRQQTSSCL